MFHGALFYRALRHRCHSASVLGCPALPLLLVSNAIQFSSFAESVYANAVGITWEIRL